MLSPRLILLCYFCVKQINDRCLLYGTPILIFGMRAKVGKVIMADEDEDQGKIVSIVKSTTKVVSISIQYPILSESNYDIWAIKMKIILCSLRVWSMIEDGDEDDDKD
jgi:hypothetical protein